MVMSNYFRKTEPFAYKDVYKQFVKIKKNYKNATIRHNRKQCEIELSIQPTINSSTYNVILRTKLHTPKVKIYIADLPTKELKIPHTYSDGSICLYLPSNNEWNYYMSWADTLIPWTSLWLYYFEIWLITGEWLGGGVHPNDAQK